MNASAKKTGILTDLLILVTVSSETHTHTPAQHVSEAYEAHVGQFKGAAVARLQELLAEVEADALHLQDTNTVAVSTGSRAAGPVWNSGTGVTVLW